MYAEKAGGTVCVCRRSQKGTAAAGKKAKGRKTLRIFTVVAFLTGGAAAVASRMPWGQFPAADEWEEQEISGSAEIRWKKAVCRTTRKRGKRS